MSVFLVWSDDDWLKKFSGKTTEETEEPVSAGGEPANTTTEEVRHMCAVDSLCSCLMATLLYAVMSLHFISVNWGPSSEAV